MDPFEKESEGAWSKKTKVPGNEKIERSERMKRLLVLGLVLSLLFLFTGCGEKSPDQMEPPEDSPVAAAPPETPAKNGDVFNQLTGEYVVKAIPLIAVMINNHPKARPQTGLAEADLVYEVEAEGLITRFLAFFHGDPPENVGPVRSTRPYYMELSQGFGAYLAHVGGSNDAYAKLAEWKVPHMDDVTGWQNGGFWLDKSRNRPHNTYLNLAKTLQNKEDQGRYPQWDFSGTPTDQPDYTRVSVPYAGDYRPEWLFDQKTGWYLRYLDGEAWVDRETKTQVAAANVIIQYASHRVLNDADHHLEIDLTGEGRAEYFLGGTYQEGTWSKKGLNEPINYYDPAGKPVALVPGPTWVQVVRTGSSIEKN